MSDAAIAALPFAGVAGYGAWLAAAGYAETRRRRRRAARRERRRELERDLGRRIGPRGGLR